MKVTHVIPVYDYLTGMLKISKWINFNYKNIFDGYEVIIYDDKPSLQYENEYNIVSEFDNFTVIHGNIENNDLRIALKIAAKNAIDKEHDAVIISETDVIPETETLKKMIEVFKKPFLKPIGSVSAMYKWNNKFCYPTHAHWFKDGDMNGKQNYEGVGNVSNVGKAGVPFLFSMWKPTALGLVNNPNLPKILGLDTVLGRIVHERGYHHLRLTDCFMEHEGGGHKSWKNFSKKGTEKIKMGKSISEKNKKISTEIKKLINRQMKIKNNFREEEIRKKREMSRVRRVVEFNEDGSKRKNSTNVKRDPFTIGPHSVKRTLSEIEKNVTNQLFSYNKKNIKNLEIPKKKIGVLLHLFYIDLWSEMERYLKNINHEFDLYINLVEGSAPYANLVKTKSIIEKKYPNSKVFINDNRGLDIGGTLALIKNILDNKKEYDLILKIHSKKSIHSANIEMGTNWRNELMNSILGSENIVDGILRIMHVDKNIGMVGSKIWHISAKNNKKLAYTMNESTINRFLNMLNINTSIENMEFIGGTVFWVDGKLFLKYFKDINLNKIRNMLEFGQFTDHQRATKTHSFERIFGLMVIYSNKKILGI